MNEKISVKPDTIYLEDLIVEIAEGKYKIPIFQRDFVWKPNQMIELFDSILKGYPIGSLLFWKPKEEYVTKDEVGPYRVTNTSREMSYVLDGFQRISTLFGVLTNPKNYDLSIDNVDVKEFLLYFNSKENSFQKVKYQKEKNVFIIPVYEIYDNRELFNLLREIDKENINEVERNNCIDNIRNLHDTLHKYRLPYVQISGGDIKSSVDIFSRINSEGTKISEDFLLSALSYNNSSGFLLAETISDVLDSFSIYNFSDLKRDTIFNCITTSSGKLYFDVKIEELKNPNKYNLEELAINSISHIRKAVDFLYNKLKVVDYRYLPYPTQFIFISEYFRLNPNENNFTKLINWFWITTYSNYFTLYSLSQQRNAYKAFCESIFKDEIDIYKVNDSDVFSTLKFPKKLDFTGVRQKALQLFMINSVCSSETLDEKESVVEQFIFTMKKGKTKNPANILIRLSSEFEHEKSLKNIELFITKSSDELLSKYFITGKMRSLYIEILKLKSENENINLIEKKIDEFLALREVQIVYEECKFVKSFEIQYN